MSGVGVAVAVGAGALLAAGGAVAGAAIEANSAEQGRQAFAEQAALDRQQQGAAVNQARADNAPYAAAGMGGIGGLGQYQQAGTDALGMQRALAGLDGPEAQKAAQDQLANSPQFAEMYRQAETALLQNQSATGGLRGGDTQGVLAQLRPALLNQLITEQYGRLGGLAGAGQSAAGGLAQLGQGAAAGQAATSIQGAGMASNTLGNLGASNANSYLAQGRAYSQGIQSSVGAVNEGLGAMGGMRSRAAGF